MKTSGKKAKKDAKLGKREGREFQGDYSEGGVYSYTADVYVNKSGEEKDIKHPGRNRPKSMQSLKRYKKITSPESDRVTDGVTKGQESLLDYDPRPPLSISSPTRMVRPYKVKFDNAQMASTKRVIAEQSNDSKVQPDLQHTPSYTEPGENGAIVTKFLDKKSTALLNNITAQIQGNNLNKARIEKQIEDNKISYDSMLKVLYIIEARNVDSEGKLTLRADVIQAFSELKLGPESRKLYAVIEEQINNNQTIDENIINQQIIDLGFNSADVADVVYILESDYYNGKKAVILSPDTTKFLGGLESEAIMRDKKASQNRKESLSEFIQSKLKVSDFDAKQCVQSLKKKVLSLKATPKEVKEAITTLKNGSIESSFEKECLKALEAEYLISSFKNEKNPKTRGNLQEALRAGIEDPSKIKSSKLAKLGKFLTFGYRLTDADLAKQVVTNYKEGKELQDGITSGSAFYGIKKDKNQSRVK